MCLILLPHSSLVVNCLSMKSKERLACDVFDTFATFQPFCSPFVNQEQGEVGL